LNQKTDQLGTSDRSYYYADPLRFMFWLLAFLVGLALAFLPNSSGGMQTEPCATAAPNAQAECR
jgi:hypothetical protein